MNQVNNVNQDLEHLKILSILFYVLSGLCLFPVLFGVIYAVMGIFFSAAMSGVPHRAGEPPAALFGGFFSSESRFSFSRVDHDCETSGK